MPNRYNHRLYQINTRIWINQLSETLNRSASLDDVPEEYLEGFTDLGFDWVYLLGVWQTSKYGRSLVRSNQEWRKDYIRVLPDLREEDMCGSCFAIPGYIVSEELGGDSELERFRDRLHKHKLRLMLDFIPNHTAIDHPWVDENPQFYIHGTEADLLNEPHNYIRLSTSRGELIFAHGRDPYFSGWSDTLQLNYGNPTLQEAMAGELKKISLLCDGVRCDMAMLVIPEVFQNTWGISARSFWPWAIERVQESLPEFVFLAEVYWGLEWSLQKQGFSYTYDKKLYDRIIDLHALPVREHLQADLAFQYKTVRFLENHDERRIAEIFPLEIHKAAAIITYLLPGMQFFHQGQLEGCKIKIPVQLCRKPEENPDIKIEQFYHQLLNCMKYPAFLSGDWQLLNIIPAWEGNWTWNNFIAYAWKGTGEQKVVVVVNYSPHQCQCIMKLPFLELRNERYMLRDLMGFTAFEQEGETLLDPGLYIDVKEWGYHVFELVKSN